jgi:hypothetical protein
MEYLRLFDILMLASTIIWVAALIIYSTLIGGIDFGPLHVFAVKSAILLFVANSVGTLPCGGWAALGVWWIGIVLLFGMEWWEAKVLVLIIWVLNFGTGMLIFFALFHRPD